MERGSKEKDQSIRKIKSSIQYGTWTSLLAVAAVNIPSTTTRQCEQASLLLQLPPTVRFAGSNRRANMVDTGTLVGQAWQSISKTNNKRLQYLYTSSELSDLDIYFQEDEDPIKAHRLVLSMNSPVFLAMLNGPLATGKELILPEDPCQSFQKLLDHIYLERMDLESVEEALEVYALAHRYQMLSAMEYCVQYIVFNVKAETMPAVLETSVLYEDAALKKKCKEILDRDPDAVMLPKTVSRLSKESLRALLTDDTLAFSSEAVPFRGLIAWGKAQLGQQEEPSGSALRAKIGDDLLREVRFLDMSCDEFVDNVIGTDVLTYTECTYIQCAIRGADPSTFSMTMPLHPARGRRRQRRKKDAALKKKCKEILDHDPDAVMLPETVSRLSKESLRALLTDDTLAFSSEAVPFRGLVAWGKAQLGQQEEPSGSALQEEIGDDLLREVRFLDMSCDEFVDNVIGTDVLTHTECIHILTAIRGADPSTLPRTTPLHLARGRRLRPKERLSRFQLSPITRRETLKPPERYTLISFLSSDRNICVHRLDAPGAGTVQIKQLHGVNVISSATSEGPEFVFALPAALERGEKYNVWFIPKTKVVANRAGFGSQRVGNVTLSHRGGCECALYLCESGSSDSE
ncbi:uncharacterized protein LOC143030480 [Oratosquilla oratoria]|uniref:uncharacterized protein LOC143030480 n=1 Tax=Oratosquilla oratoria TaxID=337810 RepID=UPI003F7658D3